MRDATLRLPVGVLQPFEIRFFADDLHVMAFFGEHPTYESVEAMIRRKPNGAAAARAIVTRRDQSQIDHVNEHALVRMAVAGRETHFSEIEFDEPPPRGDARASRARVRFVSGAGERIELDVESAGAVDAARGGLSSPGGHAGNTSLPLMVRGASALASPRTRVVVDGRSYPVPEKVRSPNYVAHEGYFTRAHHMAIVRADTLVYEMRRVPKRIEVGAEWELATADGVRCYHITAIAPDGTIEAQRAANRETLRFSLDEDTVDLHAVRVADAHDATAFAEMTFVGGEFSIGVGGTDTRVCGTVEPRTDGFELRPSTPAWAIARPVHVAFARHGGSHVVTTTVGTH